ncbi:MAG: penicillin-insensitive murein endopeptidase [Elusimicrobiota bacterium]|jgi:hypothetical protein
MRYNGRIAALTLLAYSLPFTRAAAYLAEEASAPPPQSYAVSVQGVRQQPSDAPPVVEQAAAGAPAAGSSSKKVPSAAGVAGADETSAQRSGKVFDGTGDNSAALPVPGDVPVVGEGEDKNGAAGAETGDPAKDAGRTPGLIIDDTPMPRAQEASLKSASKPAAAGWLDRWTEGLRRRAGESWDKISAPIKAGAEQIKGLIGRLSDKFQRAFLSVWSAPETVSKGEVNKGSLGNAVQVPKTPYYHVRNMSQTWGSKHMVLGLMYLGGMLSLEGFPPLQIGDVSDADGGRIDSHKSHQNGLDVDLWFYDRPNGGHDPKANFRVLELLRNNPFFSVDMAFVSPRVKEMLVSEARAQGRPELARWAQPVLRTGEPGHDTHFHVRISAQSRIGSWMKSAFSKD